VTNHRAGSPGVERHTQVFLETLAAGGGKPIEQLSPVDARAVLVSAQAGVEPDVPKAGISEKTLRADGQTVTLTVVRPRRDGNAPGVHVLPRRRMGARRLPDA
jgi:acetyl esterase